GSAGRSSGHNDLIHVFEAFVQGVASSAMPTTTRLALTMPPRYDGGEASHIHVTRSTDSQEDAWNFSLKRL
ncbi:MAG TPA: hypothetical protein VGC64_04060, partial [Pyrinomonadaceae bacterium]